MQTDSANKIVTEVTCNLSHYPEQIARVFHGRGSYFGAFSNINIEWYPPFLFVQCFAEELAEEVAQQLEQVFSEQMMIQAIIIQKRTWPEITSEILLERHATELPIELNCSLDDSLACHINLGKNRNTGAFLDMRAGWEWVKQHSANKTVLNLFSYTGIFSLFALQGGAQKVSNVDMAAGVLKTAQRNHQLNDMNTGKAAFLKRDILKSSKQFVRLGSFDLIIADPPPYQKKAFRGWQDYRRLLSWCESSLNEHGVILASLNNPQVSLEDFSNSLRECFSQEVRLESIASSPEIKEQDTEKGLKLVAVHF